MSLCSPTVSMTTSRSTARFEGSSKVKNRERRCTCGDVCHIAVSRTHDNPGRKFRACPNFRDPDGGCGFFKWLDEEDFNPSMSQIDIPEQRDTLTLLVALIVGLLMAMLLCLVLIVLKM
ncbi:hypothetical protein LXL04_038132 [Taraxacum kok-saghyz]